MARIAISGTELARLEPGSGALERAVLMWCSGLSAAGHDVVLLDADPSDDGATGNGAGNGATDDRAVGARLIQRIEEADPDLVVLNNRPLWAERLSRPVLHILHNYPDAWGGGTDDDARVAGVLSRHEVAAVSPTLARAIEERYSTHGADVGVEVVAVGVEECFFGVEWRGAGGPVLFPNRLLAKKGVRFYLDLARALSRQGRRCAMYRHIAPFAEPTPEQRDLLQAIAACPAVELLDPPGSRAAMADAYAAAGVVVCPAIHPEGLGLVALEAQAVGTPLVTSGRGGLADATFTPNEVVTPFDVGAWVAAIDRTETSGPSPLPALTVRERHDPARAADSIVPIAAQALGRRETKAGSAAALRQCRPSTS